MKTLELKLAGALAVLCLAFGVIAYLAHKNNKELKRENETLRNNISVLNVGIERYKTINGILVTKVGEIQVNYDQLKQYNTDLAKKLESMDIRTKKIESVIAEKTRTYYVIKDSVRLRDSVINDANVKCFSYNEDEHIKISACVIDIDKENALLLPNTATIEVVDSSYAVVNPVPYKFWFIKFGTKSVELQIMHTNPYVTTTGLQYYNLKKRKRR